MGKNFIEELTWRGMIQDQTAGLQDELTKGCTKAYVGIDPTGDSLHIGHLVSIMILKHFQNCGHKPVALIGGATGMIGDPSMKSNERNLLDEETLKHNVKCIREQLSRFLNFDDHSPNCATLVNNYDWMKDYTFLNFTRDIGKLLTVNYMMSKDSVKKRLSRDSNEGMSFTEFTYQLLQGYDFLYLYENMGVKLQLGGADQWGNITTGCELIRRKLSSEAYGLTCPLITKADGGKFGKTEKGNIWLDKTKTSPYEFYQFWLNVSDDDAVKYIKIFTLLDRQTIENAIEEHKQAPEKRYLQKLLAEEITVMVHGRKEYENVIEATSILFGAGTYESLKHLDQVTFNSIFSNVPHFEVKKEEFPCGVLDFLAVKTQILPSKAEARKLIQGGGISINKTKVTDINASVSDENFLNGNRILVQKGKKSYFMVNIE